MVQCFTWMLEQVMLEQGRLEQSYDLPDVQTRIFSIQMRMLVLYYQRVLKECFILFTNQEFKFTWMMGLVTLEQDKEEQNCSWHVVRT